MVFPKTDVEASCRRIKKNSLNITMRIIIKVSTLSIIEFCALDNETQCYFESEFHYQEHDMKK